MNIERNIILNTKFLKSKVNRYSVFAKVTKDCISRITFQIMRCKRPKLHRWVINRKWKESRSNIEDLRNRYFSFLASEMSKTKKKASPFLSCVGFVPLPKTTHIFSGSPSLCLFSFNKFIFRGSERFHPVSVLPLRLSGLISLRKSRSWIVLRVLTSLQPFQAVYHCLTSLWQTCALLRGKIPISLLFLRPSPKCANACLLRCSSASLEISVHRLPLCALAKRKPPSRIDRFLSASSSSSS